MHGSLLGWDVDKIRKLPIVESEAVQQFRAAMDDDFNTPNALAVVFELAKELQRERNIIVHGGKTEIPSEVLQQKWQTLVKLAAVLGFRREDEISELTDGEIEVMIQQRKDARKAKKFAEGARIRNELKARGITLIDQKDGTTTWSTPPRHHVVSGNISVYLTLSGGGTSKSIRGLTDEEIEVMIQQRKDARKAKNFAEGDRIRNELKDRGITLIDQKDGTTIWHRS